MLGEIHVGTTAGQVTITANGGQITDNTASEAANIVARQSALFASSGIGSAEVARPACSMSSRYGDRVRVEVRRGEEVVLSGDFLCFTLDRHVLDRTD